MKIVFVDGGKYVLSFPDGSRVVCYAREGKRGEFDLVNDDVEFLLWVGGENLDDITVLSEHDSPGLGDLAGVIEGWKSLGVTHQAIKYAIDRVYGGDIQREKDTKKEILAGLGITLESEDKNWFSCSQDIDYATSLNRHRKTNTQTEDGYFDTLCGCSGTPGSFRRNDTKPKCPACITVEMEGNKS